MIEQLARKIYSYMSRNIKVDEDLADVYKYGIEITISSVLNIFLVVVISLILKSPFSGISHLVCLITLRSFCGGYHANSYLKCNSLMVIFFVISYIGGRLLVFFNLTDFQLTAAVLMLAFLPIYAFAPVKNKHKLLTEHKVKRCRILSIIIYIVLSFLGLCLTFFGYLYGSIIIITLIEISGSVLFEILRQRRNRNEDP